MKGILILVLILTSFISGNCSSQKNQSALDDERSDVVSVTSTEMIDSPDAIISIAKKNGNLRSLWNYRRNRYNNNYNNNGGGGFVQAIASIFLGLILLAVFLFFWTICGCSAAFFGAGAAVGASSTYAYNEYYNASAPPTPGSMQTNTGVVNHNNSRSTAAYNNNPRQSFSQTVKDVKRDVENTVVTLNQTKAQPFSGKYNASYLDSQSNISNSIVCIFFTPDPQRQGFTITGEGNDSNGYTVIEEGFAKYDGSCWWVESKIGGNAAGGIQMLSRGKFDFGNRSFQGTWVENTTRSGQYLSFSAV